MQQLKKFFQQPWLYLAIAVFGSALKFYNLDHKLYWQDEICTMMHTSGVHLSDHSNLPVNQIKHISFYDSLLHNNSQPYSILDQFQGLATDVHLTPGHYVFLIFWERIIGDDPASYRLFSVFIFLLTLPVLFLLMKELFSADLAGWIAISLYSVSPFVHIFAQEARYYILWAFFFVLSNWLLLRAIKHNNLKCWLAYSAATLVALYVSVLSALFIASHFIYLFFLHRDLTFRYTLQLALIILLYTPWIWSLYINMDEIQYALSWHIQDQKMPAFVLLMGLFFGFKRSIMMIYDRDLYKVLATAEMPVDLAMMLLSDLLMVGFTIYLFIHLFRKTTKKNSWFLTLLILPMVLFFFVTDLYRGGFSSWFWRYHILIMVVVSIIVSSFLYNKIKEKKLFFSAVHLLIITIGIISVLSISSKRCLFGADTCRDNIADARIYSEAQKPLVITDFSLRPAVFFVILNACNSPDIDVLFARSDLDIKSTIANKDYSHVFVSHASDSLLKSIENQFSDTILFPLKEEIPIYASQVWRLQSIKN